MTAISSTVGGSHGLAGAPLGPGGRLSFAHLLRSEALKLFSLRSTYWTLGLTLVVMAGFALLPAAAAPTDLDPGSDAAVGLGASVASFGYFGAQVTFGVLGALVITGEYATGMIRSTMTVDPTRVPVLLAKALVLAGVTFVVTLAGIALSYAATLPVLGPRGLQADLADPGTIRVFLGTGLYVAAVALLAFGLGTLLRRSAATIATVLALVLLIPVVVGTVVLQVPWVADVAPYLPAAAGHRIMSLGDGDIVMMQVPPAVEPLTPWQGIGLLYAYVAAVVVAALVMLRRRDV